MENALFKPNNYEKISIFIVVGILGMVLVKVKVYASR